MNASGFKYLGFGIVLVGGACVASACGSNASTPDPGGGGGGFPGGGATGFAGQGGFMAQGGNVAQGGAVAQGGGVAQGGAAQGGASQGGAAQGGSVSVGGATNSTDIKIVGSAVQCPGTTAQLPTGTVNVCTLPTNPPGGAPFCTGAHCVPSNLLPQGKPIDTSLLAKCPDGSFCTPDDYIATYGQFQVLKCKSLSDAEGRCISKCVPQVSKQLTTLPKDVCKDSELCAPCWNPIDGTDTKACSQGCDTGPPATKVVFDPCGAGLGVCVPPSLVSDPTQLAALKAIDDPTGQPGVGCTKTDASGASYLCAPTVKAADQSVQFTPCTPTSLGAIIALKNMAGQAGGCVPKYIVPSSSQSLVNQDTCPTGWVCAPCTNPLSTPTANAPSGACPWP